MDEAVLHACLDRAMAGRMTFPETVERMIEIGVERYDADLRRLRTTYFGSDGTIHAKEIPLENASEVPVKFSADGVQAAITAIKRREIDYPEFLRRVMAAGTTSYSVYLNGGRAIYFGRDGDFHLEPFSRDQGATIRIRGIIETALYVTDVKRSADFYRRLFGFPTLLEVDRLVALNVAGENVLLLFLEGGTSEPFPVPGGTGLIPPHGGSIGGGHFAFSIADEDVEPWRNRLETEGVAVESVVSWPGGSRSIYFRDPDGNLAELITSGFWAL